jgi:hypothetical protein
MGGLMHLITGNLQIKKNLMTELKTPIKKTLFKKKNFYNLKKNGTSPGNMVMTFYNDWNLPIIIGPNPGHWDGLTQVPSSNYGHNDRYNDYF